MKRPSPRKRSLLRPVPITLTLAVLAFATWFVFGQFGLYHRHKLRTQWAQQETRIDFLEAHKQKLQQDLDALKAKDETALQTAARDFGLVAQDETIYELKVVKGEEKSKSENQKSP